MITIRKPFHESVVRFIEVAAADELRHILGPLLLETAIPTGHDRILDAWRTRARETRLFGRGEQDYVANGLERQKSEAAEKEAQKQAAQAH